MRNEQTASERKRPQPRRKIERQMLQALKDGKTWHSGNTSVSYRAPCWDVFLHGNHICEVVQLHGETFYNANLDTFRRWPTRTTVSRLRALGIDAAIRKGRPTINGTEI